MPLGKYNFKICSSFYQDNRDCSEVEELLRQRGMLERAVTTLRAQAQKQARSHRDKTTTLVKVNYKFYTFCLKENKKEKINRP